MISGEIIAGVKRTKAVGQCCLSHASFTLVLASPQVKVAYVLSYPIAYTKRVIEILITIENKTIPNQRNSCLEIHSTVYGSSFFMGLVGNSVGI